MKSFSKTLLTFALLFLAVGVAIAAVNKLMSIQIKKGKLRTAPSFLAKIVAEIDYGERVAVLEEKDLWKKVRSSVKRAEGWVHVSALTYKKIILKPGAAEVEQAATSDELALAGKGFSKQVEGEFRSKNPDLHYVWINEMERMIVTRKQMWQFLDEGKLFPKGALQ